MIRIILTDDVAKLFRDLIVRAEVCDSSGNVLGRFVPSAHISNYVPLTPDVSDEELERRANSKGKRYTTAEVLAHLESLK